MFIHPQFMYIVVSDQNPNRVLSSSTSIRRGKALRKQFEDTMGQGVTVQLLKVEECTLVE